MYRVKENPKKKLLFAPPYPGCYTPPTHPLRLSVTEGVVVEPPLKYRLSIWSRVLSPIQGELHDMESRWCCTARLARDKTA